MRRKFEANRSTWCLRCENISKLRDINDARSIVNLLALYLEKNIRKKSRMPGLFSTSRIYDFRLYARMCQVKNCAFSICRNSQVSVTLCVCTFRTKRVFFEKSERLMRTIYACTEHRRGLDFWRRRWTIFLINSYFHTVTRETTDWRDVALRQLRYEPNSHALLYAFVTLSFSLRLYWTSFSTP